jgi:Mg2+ and Co2+ transporter CorA
MRTLSLEILFKEDIKDTAVKEIEDLQSFIFKLKTENSDSLKEILEIKKELSNFYVINKNLENHIEQMVKSLEFYSPKEKWFSYQRDGGKNIVQTSKILTDMDQRARQTLGEYKAKE